MVIQVPNKLIQFKSKHQTVLITNITYCKQSIPYYIIIYCGIDCLQYLICLRIRIKSLTVLKYFNKQSIPLDNSHQNDIMFTFQFASSYSMF